MGHLQ